MRVPFSIPPGIVGDDTSFTVGQGGWKAGSMVRFWRGKPQVVGGWEKTFLEPLGGVCRNILPFTDNYGSLNIAFGTHATLEVFVGGSLYDITPVGLAEGAIDGSGAVGYGTGTYGTGAYSEPSTIDYYPRTWSLAPRGEALYACPRGGTIYAWLHDIGTPAEALTNAPERVESMGVTPGLQVMAFGCSETVSGNFNPLAIRFSDPDDTSDWTSTPTNLAGEEILGGSGRIVGHKFVGAHVMVWTDSDLYLGTYTGSEDKPWKFDRVGAGCGLIGPNAVAVVKQTAYWLGRNGQFYQAPLGAPHELVVSPVRDYLFDHLTASQFDKVIAASVNQFGEVWWFYPDSRDGSENSRAVSVSLVDGAWSTHQIARTAFVDADPGPYPIGATYDGVVYWHEKGNSADGGALSWFLESADQYLNKSQDLLLIRGMIPDFQDQRAGVSLSIITRAEAQDAETTSGPYVLTPTTLRSDFFVEGRLARMRIEGNAGPTFMRLGLPSFDVERAGEF